MCARSISPLHCITLKPFAWRDLSACFLSKQTVDEWWKVFRLVSLRMCVNVPLFLPPSVGMCCYEFIEWNFLSCNDYPSNKKHVIGKLTERSSRSVKMHRLAVYGKQWHSYSVPFASNGKPIISYYPHACYGKMFEIKNTVLFFFVTKFVFSFSCKIFFFSIFFII